MKRLAAMLFVFAIFILPNNFCAAANEVPVYNSSWDNFSSTLEKKCNEFGVTKWTLNFKEKSPFYENVRYGNTAVRGKSTNFNNFISSIRVTASSFNKNQDIDINQYAKVLTAVLYTIGLNDEEVLELSNKWVADGKKFLGKGTGEFKKRYTVYCSAKKFTVALDMSITDDNITTEISARQI